MTQTEPRDEQKRRMGFSPTEPRGGEGLKPCPFCGSEPEINDRKGGTWIRCPNDQCIISTDVPIPFNDIGHREAAIQAWNRRPPVVHGWPEREAVARVIDPEAFDHPTVHPQHLILRRARARSKADAIIALFPPVVGWRPTDREDDLVAALRSIAEGNLGDQPWQADYETIKQVARNAIAYRAALPAAPLTDGVG